MQDDQKIVEKVLFGNEKMTRTDNKYELDSLIDTATIFFHFIQAFGIKLKLHNFVNIWMVEDRV